MGWISKSGVYPIVKEDPMRFELRTRSSVQAGIITDEICGNVRFIKYQPGNKRVYKVIFTDLSCFSQEVSECLKADRQKWMIQVMDQGCPFFTDSGSELLYYEVRSKLECSIFDAIVITELVGSILDCDFTSVDRFLQERSA